MLGKNRFSIEQIIKLEKHFLTIQYPTTKEKLIISVETGLKYDQVNLWFVNTRFRKKHFDVDKAILRKFLLDYFQNEKYPTNEQFDYLVIKTNKTEKYLKLWFANKRHKEKINI